MKHYAETLQALEPALTEAQLKRYPMFNHPLVGKRDKIIMGLPEAERTEVIWLIMENFHGGFQELLDLARTNCTQLVG